MHARKKKLKIKKRKLTILKLLTSENETLLIWGNALLILNLALDVVDRIRRFDLQGDGLASNYSVMLAIAMKVGVEEDIRVLTKICML